MPTPRIDLPMDAIADFCRRWRITEFALFGSVLRDDFRPDSDVDVLVTFAADARWGLLDFIRAQRELSDVLQRTVDLVERPAIEKSRNPVTRRWILETAEVIHVAA
jgi:predicted nucleotidyltransferase